MTGFAGNPAPQSIAASRSEGVIAVYPLFASQSSWSVSAASEISYGPGLSLIRWYIRTTTSLATAPAGPIPPSQAKPSPAGVLTGTQSYPSFVTAAPVIATNEPVGNSVMISQSSPGPVRRLSGPSTTLSS